MRRTFTELIAEGDAVPVEGWDFSWFDGRATEERTVPGFTAAGYAESLARMHEHIEANGSFVSHAQRFLIEARKPT